MKKTPIILSLVLITGLTMGLKPSFAQSVNAELSSTKTIMERIAEKFNLNLSEVQSVFKSHRDEKELLRTQRLEEKLNAAVSSGKISESQKAALIDKFKAMNNQKDEWMNLSHEERHTRMEQARAEFQKWLRENNINLEDLDLGFGHGRHGKFGKF